MSDEKNKPIGPSDFDEAGHLSNEYPKLLPEIRAQAKDMFDFAYELNALCQKALYASTFKPEKDEQHARVILYLHILRTFQAFIRLSEYGLQEQAIALLRIMMEAVFKIKALKDNPELSKQFYDDFSLTRKTFGKDIKELIQRGQLQYPDEEIEKLKASFKETEEIKVNKMTVSEWAKAADMENMFMMLYNLFSQPIHSNPHQLDKYLDVNEGTGKVLHNPFPKYDSLEKNIHFSCVLLTIAVDCIGETLKTEKGKARYKDQFKIKRRRLAALGDQLKDE